MNTSKTWVTPPLPLLTPSLNNELPYYQLIQIRKNTNNYQINKYPNNVQKITQTHDTSNTEHNNGNNHFSDTISDISDFNDTISNNIWDINTINDYNCNDFMYESFDKTEDIISINTNLFSDTISEININENEPNMIRLENDSYNINDLKSYHSTNPWKCPICNHFYTSLVKLKQCNCDSNFTGLKSHYKIHTNKAHYCSFPNCNFKTIRLKQLEQHLRVHTGERPFKCNYCIKAFKHKHTLKAHIRTHTGEKPYPCTLCNKRFRIKYNLHKHMKIHNKIRDIYWCKECNKYLKSKEGATGHGKRYHNGSMESFITQRRNVDKLS